MICVVHLVRRGEPQDSLRAFLDSYARHDAGVAHRMVLLLKGFRSGEEARPYTRLAGALVDETLAVGDQGFDLTAYAAAAHMLDGEQLCFLNSHSAILAPDWLAKLHGGLTDEVGIVGASGSWTSSKSLVRCLMRLPSQYGELFSDRSRLRAQLNALWGASARNEPEQSYVARARAALEGKVSAVCTQFTFPPFPAPHVRTNAFLISASVMRRLRIPKLRWKHQAWRLESGRGSITAQVEAMGLRACVVGRDGAAYDPEDWHRSSTFWQEHQQNLLVADNQTRLYQLGDLDHRTMLSRLAWGERARPLAPEP